MGYQGLDADTAKDSPRGTTVEPEGSILMDIGDTRLTLGLLLADTTVLRFAAGKAYVSRPPTASIWSCLAVPNSPVVVPRYT